MYASAGSWSVESCHDSSSAPAASAAAAAELGYGVETPGSDGLVRPYAGVTLAEGGAPVYRPGGPLSLGQSFSLDPEADRARAPQWPPEHSLKLNATLRW